ncbi:hypothetical protein D3C87_1918350 [compost metagenome]
MLRLPQACELIGFAQKIKRQIINLLIHFIQNILVIQLIIHLRGENLHLYPQ